MFTYVLKDNTEKSDKITEFFMFNPKKKIIVHRGRTFKYPLNMNLA